MPIVTLTSDWNKDDFYVASVKGKILSLCPDATIVDITHQVPVFNIAQAAFYLKNSYRNFPDETIHIIAICSEIQDDRPHVVVKANKHYFISADNGIFGLMLEDIPQEAVIIKPSVKKEGSFPELSVFADAACQIILKKKLSDIGKKYDKLYKQVPMLPAIEESVINGSVIYIDSYRNVISNISEELFNQIGKGRAFDIYIQSNHYRINKINKTYNETTTGEMLAIFNSLGMLEIAINGGNAAELLNLSVNSPVRIKFQDKQKDK